MSSIFARRVRVLAACMLVYSSALPASETDAVQQRLQQLEQEIKALRATLSAMENAAQQTATTAPAQHATAAPSHTPIQVGLSSLFTAGGSSVDNAALEGLQAGAHDPNRNGFTVQNVELTLSGTVDPYFDAQASIILQIDSAGETKVELEEAFFTTRGLPAGLQVKGGQYFTEFGRHNAQHPHSWAFVDQPLILSRLFGGDGLRSQGARVSWLTPLPWYSELYVGAQNPNGETATSFLYEENEEIGGHTLLDRSARDAGDLLYSARWLNGLDLSDTVSMNLGLSGLRGPNASGLGTDTTIYGADLYLKWQPAQSQRGFPFVAWHSELLNRRYQTDAETLKDWGGFTQALWGFTPGWVAGLRLEYAEGSGGAVGYDISADALRDNRTRLSPNLTWYPTEYSKLRLQYNRDWAEHLAEKDAHALWLQMEFSLGAHAAHTF
ncbi:MAG: TonB-dependent receptor [Gammaproteobacteria bacterium]|nr:TonB-dependent receptor [Gammaproteobacteria bacterium]